MSQEARFKTKAQERVNRAAEEAAVPVLARIREDAGKARGLLRAVILYVERNLLKTDLDAQQAVLKAGGNTHTMSSSFQLVTESTLADYIRDRRMQVAEPLLYHTKYQCWRIAYAVGYAHYSTFNDACKTFHDKTPGKVRKAGPPASASSEPRDEGVESSAALWERVGKRAPLEDPVQDRFLREFATLYPGSAERMLRIGRELCPEPPLIVDRESHDDLYAEGLWAKIRDLPFDEQRRRIRAKLDFIRKPDLFHLLRKLSRVEGRRKRERGIELMQLAMVSLEGGKRVFGDQIHDLLALGYAELGNAHVVAYDFASAKAAFASSDVEWSQPSAPREPARAGRIASLKGTFATFEGRFDRALKLVERARGYYREASHLQGEVETLNQAGAILAYAGDDAHAITALLEAQRLVGAVKDPYTPYAIASGLANVCGRLGNLEAAVGHLSRARDLLTGLEHPLGHHELGYLEGYLRHALGESGEAKTLYATARLGFIEAEEMTWLALVDLDLALLHSDLGDWPEVLRLVSEAVPLLKPLRLGRETVKAVELLADAVKAEEVPREVLLEVRDRLEKDPLTHLA